MERRVGEVFEFEGKNLKVIQSDDCCGCYFESEGKGCLNKSHGLTGECNQLLRDFNVGVIFKDVEEIQRRIGEVFEIDGVKYKCVRFNPSKCVDCCFKDNESLCEKQLCTSLQREDKEEVIFEKVQE